MKRPLRTEKELWDWFRYMRNFDLTRLEERRQLIDVFVNTVFLYNDRFLLTLNFGYGSKTVLFTDIPCSDKVACGRPQKRMGETRTGRSAERSRTARWAVRQAACVPTALPPGESPHFKRSEKHHLILPYDGL